LFSLSFHEGDELFSLHIVGDRGAKKGTCSFSGFLQESLVEFFCEVGRGDGVIVEDENPFTFCCLDSSIAGIGEAMVDGKGEVGDAGVVLGAEPFQGVISASIIYDEDCVGDASSLVCSFKSGKAAFEKMPTIPRGDYGCYSGKGRA
jgi:hypothetical protein